MLVLFIQKFIVNSWALNKILIIMKKFLLSCFLALGIGATNAQTTLIQDGFDYPNSINSVPNWTVGNVGTLGYYGYNTFGVQAGCTGNHITGTALQVIGLPSSSASCNYSNVSALNTGFGALVYRQVDASAYDNLKLSYKWKCGGEAGADYGVLVYSVNTGGTWGAWTVIGAQLQGQTTPQTVTDLALPAALDNKLIRIGWIFYANATTVSQPGLSIDDVLLVGTAPATCSGAPSAGTASLSSNIGSSGTVVVANATGISAGGGIAYQWQISTDGGGSWSDVAAATTVPANITIPAGTMGAVLQYRLKTDCTDSGQTSYSNVFNYTLDYCGPVTIPGGNNVFPISSVKIGALDKTSTATPGTATPAHEYFINDATNFEVEREANIAMDVVTFANTYTIGLTFFIDWNHNGNFNDPGEAYHTTAPLTGTGTGGNITINANFVVPADAELGKTRMRVKANYYDSATYLPYLSNPCSGVTNGQAEDHILDIKPSTVVTAPACTTFTAPTDGATNVVPNANLAWNAAASATDYKVYVGTTSGGTDIVNGALAGGLTYNANLSPNTTYYAKIVPTNSIGDATGCTEISFTTGNLVYCSANVTASDHEDWEKISRVRIADIDNPSTSVAGYEDFTSIVGSLHRKETYPTIVNISDFDSLDKTTVWIDFNQNGVFGDNANEVFTLTSTAIATGNVVVPEDAKLGNTRMRVRTNYGSAAPSPCGDASYGQIEDYTIDIKAALAVANVSKSNVSVYPNPFVDVLKISDVKDVKSISISDASGRQVKTLAPAAELNLSSLKTGVYVVTLKMNDGSVKTFKTIKK